MLISGYLSTVIIDVYAHSSSNKEINKLRLLLTLCVKNKIQDKY